MDADGLCYVLGKVLVNHGGGAAGFQSGDDLGNLPALNERGFDDGHGAVVLLDDDLQTLLHLRQHRVGLAGQFGFCYANSRHVFYNSVSSSLFAKP